MTKSVFHRSPYYTFLAISAIGYGLITFFSPVNSNPYHLTATQLHLLQLTFVVPIIGIWIAAFFGGVRFLDYAARIKNTPDGKALGDIANGLMITAVGLVITQLISSFKPLMLSHGTEKPFIIVSNYLALAFTLASSYLLYRGSQKTLTIISNKSLKPSKQTIVTIGLAVISVGYIVATMRTPYRNATPDPARFNSYYLADWLILISIVVPHIIAWFWGVRAALAIWTYQTHVKGSVYRAALLNLGRGIVAITLFSILLQFFTTIAASLANLSLGSILVIVYIIILMYAVGYLLVASGAKHLAKIEELNG